MTIVTINPAGFNQDINAAELPPDVWNAGDNVLFPNGFPANAPGWDTAAPGMLFRPLWLLPFYTTDTFYWIYVGNNDAGDAGGIGLTDGTTHWDITPAAWSPMTAGSITGGVLNSVPFINNGIDEPVWWDGVVTNVCTLLPGWPAAQRCLALRPFKYHIIAMNLSDAGGDFPDLVAWSDAANPGTIPQEWVPDPSNQAGNFTISATTGGIVDGLSLRDSFFVYKQHSTAIMQYIAGQFVFSNRKAFTTSGILARNCAQEMYGAHYVITDGDIIKHNGQEVQSLVDGKMRNFIFEQIDPEAYLGTFMAASHSKKEMWCCFPKAGHIYSDTAMVFDVVSGEWGLSELPDVPFIARGILNDVAAAIDYDSQLGDYDSHPGRYNQRRFNPTSDTLVMAQPADKTLLVHGGSLRSGESVKVFMALYSKDLGENSRLKLIKSIWPHFEGGGSEGSDTGYTVRVGFQMELAQPIAWSDRVLISSNVENKADFLVTGRYISIEIEGDQRNPWRLNSIDMEFTLQGRW